MTDISRRLLKDPVDLVGLAGDDGFVFQRNGVGVAGRGVHRRIPSGEADEILAGLGPDVVALGARPFDPDAEWDLVVPAYQVCVDEHGNARELSIDGATAPTIHPTTPSQGVVEVSNVDDPTEWQARVGHAIEEIRANRVDKVVLAREMCATSSTPFSPRQIAERLATRFAGCFIYSIDGLVGASPELLVARSGDRVWSQPMAGSAQRSEDAAIDAHLQAELFASSAYRHEHQLTIDMVHDTLLDFTSYLDFEPEPSIVVLENVAHLATRVEGELSSPPASILDLQRALHPTPAVSGRPRGSAIEIISELEPRGRGRYAGTVGWVDGSGNGCWAVTIRCAQIDPATHSTARVHAGCGLVADSMPERELAESDAKLRAILAALS